MLTYTELMSLSLDKYYLVSLKLTQCNKHVITLSDQMRIVFCKLVTYKICFWFFEQEVTQSSTFHSSVKRLYGGHIEKINRYFLDSISYGQVDLQSTLHWVPRAEEAQDCLK